mgnify:CR=1 FL=1
MKIPFIAWLTIREASRRRILWVGFGLAIAFLILFAVGFDQAFREILAHTNRPRKAQTIGEVASFFTIAGLYAVNFLVVMLSVLASVDTISGEIATHSIQSIVTKPICRWEVVLGKYLGFVLLIVTEVVLLGGGVMLITRAISGYTVPQAGQGLGLMILEGLVLVSLTMLGGARFSTLTNGVLVFMLFGLAFLGGWVEQFGGFAGNESAIRVGIITSLILPTEALWKRAAYLMQPPLFQSFAATPFAVTSVPSPAMVYYTIAYAAVALMAATRAFAGRDL